MAEQGTFIGGKYEIQREIGRGGMSIVYLAMDKNLNKLWAVKEIRHDVYGEERKMVVQSFLTEANLMKRLDHPTLPRIVDIIDDNYVVMDYIEGESLEKVLAKTGAQKQEQVIEWGKTLCEVLDYLHTRKPPIIYRDMKPSNIKLRPQGSIPLFVFGIAREYKQENSEDTTYLGTRGYAAPEQFGGKGQTDARTDVYCLGMTLHHLVTGKNPSEPPYEVYPIRHWNPALSSGLEWIIRKSTQLNPEDRFQSCAEMLYALENVEKYSGQYRDQQKKKIHIFVSTLVLAFVFLGVGIGATVMRGSMISQRYGVYLEAGTADDYKEAIKLDPSREEAYEQWIALYTQRQSGEEGLIDIEYTAEEAQKLEGIFNSDNLEELKKKNPEEYAKVCYNTGVLTWYNYKSSNAEQEETGTSSQANGIVRSIKWFQRVQELNAQGDTKYLTERERACADCYYNIGTFFSEKQAQLGDTGGKKIYRDYFDNVMQLIKTLRLDEPQKEDDDVDDNMRIQMYELILYSLESDIKQFRLQGVTNAEAQELFDIAAVNTEELVPITEAVETKKNSILERKDRVQQKIDMEYGGEGKQNE